MERKKKNGAFLLLLTRFKEGRRVDRSGEWRRRVREGGCTCRTRFLSDDKEQSKEEGEEEDRRRFPARGHRTIIFPLPGGDIALFPSIECFPPPFIPPVINNSNRRYLAIFRDTKIRSKFLFPGFESRRRLSMMAENKNIWIRNIRERYTVE